MKPYKTITLRLNANEYAHLKQQAEATGLKMEPLLRHLILGVQLRPRPPDTYAALLPGTVGYRQQCQPTGSPGQRQRRGQQNGNQRGGASGTAGRPAGKGHAVMAYTKILVVHNRLDKSVAYVQNEEKTSLEAAIDYALNRDKTEQVCFETAINCDRETVYTDMLSTKRRWGKEERKRKGYHIIQSFAPGEVTPEEAHAIGVELAQRLLGDRYEAIVATHLNKAHLHSHIVFNSVSFVDGAMYRDTLKDYYGGDGTGIRGTSDAICREHGLSVMEPDTPQRGPVSRGEWEAGQGGKATLRGLVREDIDAAPVRGLHHEYLLAGIVPDGL